MKNILKACRAIVLPSLIFYSPGVWAQCSLNIPGAVSSGWSKKGVSYTVEGNTLKIKASGEGKDDTDSIYIGSINGCSSLTIIVSQISGDYPWGGKAIGFSFSNEALQPHQWGNQASFPPPKGRAIEDGFIKEGLSSYTKLVYDIDNNSKTTHIGAKVFIGRSNDLELQFSAQQASPAPQIAAQPAPRERQAGAQQVSRSSNRSTAQTGHQPDDRAMSCALNCHGPRTEHGEIDIDYPRAFSMPPRDACRYRGD